jgi:hypothetical protein
MTTSRLLLAIALLAALAACEIGGRETHTGAGAACFPVAAACTQSSDCCSYGCVGGICTANPAEGGICRTSNDCAAGRLCKSGACTTPTVGMCRDTTDVCTSYLQCCSGNCEVGSCTQNRAPVANAGPTDVPDVPYTKLYTLQSASTDPDGDPLSHSWSFVAAPLGSQATISGAASATATFTPDRVGTYQVRLVVTDGPTGAPNRLTSETTVTLHVVNREPQPTATAAAAPGAPACVAAAGQLACSRNNPVRISATATDADGDTLDCGWRVTVPGATEPTLLADFAACANPSSTFLDYTPTGEGTYVVEYVVRDHDRATGTMVVHTVPAAATFVSKNDPPTVVVSRSPYYANMGATVDTTPAVPLDASASTDVNGDHLVPPGPLSFFWEMVSWPGAPATAAPQIIGFDTATPSFVPGAEGDHVLRLTVTDAAQFGRGGDSSSIDVTVRVEHHVQLLPHGVVDVARAATARTSGILVMAAKDPTDTTNTKGMLWVYDLATGSEDAAGGIPLADSTGASGIPKLLDVTPDGSRAVVVDEGVSVWVVNLAARTMVRLTRPYAIGDVVVAGNRYAYLFGTPGPYTYSTVRELDVQAAAPVIGTAPWSGYGHFGTAYSSGTTTYVYRADAVFNDWDRYAVNNSGAASSWSAYAGLPTCGSSYPATFTTAMWATQNATFANAYLVTSCGGVYRADTLASLGTSLGVSPTHVDSTSGGAILACEGTTLSRFNAALQPAGTDLLPAWSQYGYGRTTYASRAFFDTQGTKRFAVVHDTATPVRYGIVTFP